MDIAEEQARKALATQLYRAPARPFTKEQVVAAIRAAFDEADAQLKLEAEAA